MWPTCNLSSFWMFRLDNEKTLWSMLWPNMTGYSLTVSSSFVGLLRVRLSYIKSNFFNTDKTNSDLSRSIDAYYFKPRSKLRKLEGRSYCFSSQSWVSANRRRKGRSVLFRQCYLVKQLYCVASTKWASNHFLSILITNGSSSN